MRPTPYIASLHIYPVKGLQGVEVDAARVTPFGLAGDRRYMLVDAEDRFISQRFHPQLTQFGVEVVQQEGGSASTLRISHSDAGVLEVPLEREDENDRALASLRVQVWDDVTAAVDVGAEARAFFSDALREDIRLVWMPEVGDRFADPAYASGNERVSFADGFPLLVLGQASIDELNTRLEVQVPLNRFRANVIVGGTAPWEEDGWKEMSTGEVRLDVVKPCARCVVITTDQETGERSKEPTATLATYRRREGKVMVGMNALASPVGSSIHAGASVLVK